ncbi:Lysine ketoglutarate reductase trans-splicing protein [Heracleum sosnowskyi]|uniref:Lysine ketoglutarate reductase trans-splicing protein n=1 Tax=Heracleum sosnowskyi TaxID=360622 RepID=A0AAD8HFW4_9APIA|nr:Lysine ketoglutarate reductase trans-splicing protein [Heracleum sosnowskyi]
MLMVKRMARNQYKYQKTIAKMGHIGRSAFVKKANETTRFMVTTFIGMFFGFLMGASFPVLSLSKLSLSTGYLPLSEYIQVTDPSIPAQAKVQISDGSKIWVPSNPRGAERLPPGVVVPGSDFYPRRLYGKPSEDFTAIPKYLVTFTVGHKQMQNIDAAIKKFSANFTVLLFHYDNRTSDWDAYEWSKKVIHISVQKQTKWWFAKRFLHPDIVSAYEYIFIWDEDLGVEHFESEEYIKLLKKHGLEISQPGLEPAAKGLTWQMTKRRGDREVHKETQEKPGWCPDPYLPPCAGFVEIMAPVFSGKAWRCVWHMIQNDLIHGWGLDFAVGKCVEPAHEKIGVVDAQWIEHQGIPSLGGQGETNDGKQPWQGVRARCRSEWKTFQDRLVNAEKDYYKSMETYKWNMTG